MRNTILLIILFFCQSIYSQSYSYEKWDELLNNAIAEPESTLKELDSLKSGISDSDSLSLFKYYFRVAVANDISGNFEEALKQYIKAEKLIQYETNYEERGDFYSNFGAYYIVLGQKKKAEENYLKSIEERQKSGNINRIIDEYTNLLIAIKQQGDTLRAIECSEKILNELLPQTNDPFRTFNSYLNYSGMKLDFNDLEGVEEALLVCEKVISGIVEKDQFPNFDIYYSALYSRLAEYYGHYDKTLDKAIYYAHLSLKSSNIELDQEQAEYELLSILYERNNQSDSALFYLKKSFKLKESLQAEVNKIQLVELEQKYEAEKKDNVIAQGQLEIDNLGKRNTILFILITASAIIVLILIFLFRQKKKLSDSLKDKNDIIIKNLNEKEILMREIHHRVKNNLQMIVSMLQLQKNSLKEKDSIDAIQNIQSRVQSIGLIHEQLYKQDLNEINLKRYIDNLCESIKGLNATQKTIVFNNDIEETNFPVQLVLNLGLVLNELLTNTLKHAKTPEDTIKIDIQIGGDENAFKFTYKDNGEQDEQSSDNTGFGTHLIDLLVKRLGAQSSYQNENGLKVLTVEK